MPTRRINLRNVTISLIAMIFALPFFGSDAAAQSTQVAGTPQQHHIELEELKAEMRALQNKIDSMESMQAQEKEKDGWFDDIEIKTKNGKRDLTISTTDGNYKLRTRLRGQFLALYSDPDGGDENLQFRIRRLRVTWDGNAFVPWFKYKIQVDMNDDFELKDMIFDFAYNKMFVPRVGQYKVPFNREVQNSSSELQLVGRSIVNDAFEWDRDIGFGLHGSDGKYWKYELMLSGGEGPNNRDTDDTGVLWSGRVQFDPLGAAGDDVAPNMADKPSLLIGAAIAGLDIADIGTEANEFPLQDRFADLGISEGRVTAFTADASFRTSRFNIEGEYNGRWIGDDDPALSDGVYDQGFRVQGGAFIIPDTLEVAGRWAYVDFDDDSPDGLDSTWAITPGINYYLSKDHRWKFQVDYSFIREEGIDGIEEDENLIQAQLQAYF